MAFTNSNRQVMQDGTLATKHIHVVAFHVPFPPNYGGAVDVFYKLKALHSAGYMITLHAFLYDGDKSRELEEICEKVYYYRRDTSLFAHLSLKPYIVRSRKNARLMENLMRDDSPILFEGLHTCYYLDDARLRNRRKTVRMHNIEHDYYRLLFRQSGWGIRKVYYFVESLKLKRYQPVLRYADRILPISQADTECLKRTFPEKDVRLLRCFFDDTTPVEQPSPGKYILYHGNLAVKENVTAVLFLLREVLPLLPKDSLFVIAGRNPAAAVSAEVRRHDNVRLVSNPDDREMNRLLYNAQVNILVTFQPTGIKLKLLNTLCESLGHCIVNDQMVQGNDLERLCRVANSADEIARAVTALMPCDNAPMVLEERRKTIREMGYNDISPIVSD